MTTPVHSRVESAAGSGGLFGPSGVRRLRAMLSSADSAASYHDWAEAPVTRAVVAALRDIAVNGTPTVDTGDVAVQYGITLGVSLAANLISDPSSVYPEVFTGQAEQAMPASDFAVNPHEALDFIGEN